MQQGFRRFSDGYRVVVFTNNPKTTFPDYMRIEAKHDFLERDDVLQFVALVPCEKGVDFWKWCQGQEGVAIKLDTQQEFHCPSCLLRTGQRLWSPPVDTHGGWKQAVVRCEECGSFYIVLYQISKKRISKKRRYK